MSHDTMEVVTMFVGFTIGASVSVFAIILIAVYRVRNGSDK